MQVLQRAQRRSLTRQRSARGAGSCRMREVRTVRPLPALNHAGQIRHHRPALVVNVDRLPPWAVGDQLVQELVQPGIGATLAYESGDGVTSHAAAARALDQQDIELTGDVRDDDLTGAGHSAIIESAVDPCYLFALPGAAKDWSGVRYLTFP